MYLVVINHDQVNVALRSSLVQRVATYQAAFESFDYTVRIGLTMPSYPLSPLPPVVCAGYGGLCPSHSSLSCPNMVFTRPTLMSLCAADLCGGNRDAAV